MKRYLILPAVFAVAVVLMFPFFGGNASESVFSPGEAEEAYAEVYEYGAAGIALISEDGTLLYAKNKDEKRGMASTTKIMTCLVAIENGDPDASFVIPKDAVGIEGSSVYLTEGETLTLRELLYCLMLESGNDAATAIAYAISGSETEFVALMNERAAEMNLKSTHFDNPHGLSSETHYTTAYELALITKEAMQYPLFREIVSTKNYSVRYNGSENGRALVNHNKLLFSSQGCIGVKTGYTKADGKCLVSAFEKNGMLIICATLGDPYPSGTHKVLAEKAFSEYNKVLIANAGELRTEISVSGGEKEKALASNTEDVYIILKKGSNFEIEYESGDICAPVGEGEEIAAAKIISEGKVVDIIILESEESVAVKKYGFFEKIFGKDK